jgi:O-antigen/teichoic acid export membrane protein
MGGFWNWVNNLFINFKGLSFLGLASVLTNAIGGIFWFYMASLLGAENYGEVSYYIGISMLVASMALLGAPNLLVVFVAKGEKIQSTVYLISIISSVIAAIILLFTFGNLGVSFYTIGFVVFTLATSELIGLKRFKDYSIYLILQRILMVGLSVLFYYLLGPNGIILGIGISFLLVVPKIYKTLKNPLDFSFYKSKANFVANNFAIDISGLFRGYLDKLIIAPILGFALLGNYQLGIQFLAIISIIPNVIAQYLLPQEASGKINDKLKIVAVLSSAIFTIIAYFTSPVLLPIVFPEFVESIQIIQIMSFAIIPGTINSMFMIKYLAKEQPKINLIGSIIFIVTQVIGIFTLNGLFGIYGVAASMVIALSLESTYFAIIDKIIFREK